MISFILYCTVLYCVHILYFSKGEADMPIFSNSKSVTVLMTEISDFEHEKFKR